MFTQKYKPKSLKQVVGQSDSIEKFLKWIDNWKKGDAIIFHGPPGVGKTALIEAFAAERNMDLIQMNASDFRNAEEIHDVIGRSVTQQSLFKKGKIFLIDEIDGLSGIEDRGGVGEIVKIIKESMHPIVLTANDAYNPKLRPLRAACDLIQFKRISAYDVRKKLEEISKSEDLESDTGALSSIANTSGGDLRSAIIDLEVFLKSESGMPDVNETRRERVGSIFDALKTIFKTESALSARLALEGVDKNFDEIFWWIESNISNEYEDPEEVAKAFDELSRADIFRQRIRYRQNWKLLKYFIDLMTGGVAVSKKKVYRKFTRYQYPRNLAILGGSKLERAGEKEVLQNLGSMLHCSRKSVRKFYVPYLKIIAPREVEVFKS